MEGSLKKGVSSEEKITQKKPRGETPKGQRPTKATETVASDRGSFKCK